MVELALALPLLLILISGVLHFGILYYTQLGLQGAIESGATFGSLHPSSDTAIQSAILKSLPATIDPNDVSIGCVDTGSRTKGKLVTISMYYDIAFLRSMPLGAIIPAPTRVYAKLTFVVLV